MQLAPMSGIQYILYWYIAETVPPDVEIALNKQEEDAKHHDSRAPYQYPPKYPLNLDLRDRIAMEPKGWLPVRHDNTGVDADEALYESYLLPIEEATQKLKAFRKTLLGPAGNAST